MANLIKNNYNTNLPFSENNKNEIWVIKELLTS